MHVQIHFQGLESSPWVEKFLMRKVEKLERYLTPASALHIHLKQENQQYVTSMDIQNPNRSYSFTAGGDNLYESFSVAVDKAARSLGEHKRLVKDKINSRFFSLKRGYAA